MQDELNCLCKTYIALQACEEYNYGITMLNLYLYLPNYYYYYYYLLIYCLEMINKQRAEQQQQHQLLLRFVLFVQVPKI